ncbi:MAG TPA: hypothetical protein PKA48_08750, partial [Candidatus Obscuribacter sp.]|nr:hypothetical protein [Candidatus Obscuribacter sp.]
MGAINPEMLRELLDEFTEKEAVTREEINVITQQIGELEKRIETNQGKLESLVKDKEKVLAMKERYLSGNWPRVFKTDNGDGAPGKEESGPAVSASAAQDKEPAVTAEAAPAASAPANTSAEESTGPAISAPQTAAPVVSVVTSPASPTASSTALPAVSAEEATPEPVVSAPVAAPAQATDLPAGEVAAAPDLPSDDPILSSMSAPQTASNFSFESVAGSTQVDSTASGGNVEDSGFSWASTASAPAEGQPAASDTPAVIPWGEPATIAPSAPTAAGSSNPLADAWG